jgi:hypothetical protein
MWREWTKEGGSWRGCVIHLQSGKSRAFQEAAELLDLLAAFGVHGEPFSRSDDQDPDVLPRDGHGMT